MTVRSVQAGSGEADYGPCEDPFVTKEDTGYCDSLSRAFEYTLVKQKKRGQEFNLEGGMHHALDIRVSVGGIRLNGANLTRPSATVIVCGTDEDLTDGNFNRSSTVVFTAAPFLQNISGGGGRCFSSWDDSKEQGKQTFISSISGVTFVPRGGHKSIRTVDSSYRKVSHYGGALFLNAAMSPVMLRHVTFAGFYAVNHGGAVMVMDMGPATPLTIENAAFLYNAAGQGDGKKAAYGASRTGDDAFGGAISIVNAVVDITDTSFVGNEAGQGGAISIASHEAHDDALMGERRDWAKYKAKTSLTRVEVHSNTARVSGGAMFVENAEVDASATHFGDYFNEATETCRSGQRFWDKLKKSAEDIVLPTPDEIDMHTNKVFSDVSAPGIAKKTEGLAAAGKFKSAVDSFQKDIVSGLLNKDSKKNVHQKDISPNVETIRSRIHAIVLAVDERDALRLEFDTNHEDVKKEATMDKKAKDTFGKLQNAIDAGPVESDMYGYPCGAPILGDGVRFVHQTEYEVAKAKDDEIDAYRNLTTHEVNTINETMAEVLFDFNFETYLDTDVRTMAFSTPLNADGVPDDSASGGALYVFSKSEDNAIVPIDEVLDEVAKSTLDHKKISFALNGVDQLAATNAKDRLTEVLEIFKAQEEMVNAYQKLLDQDKKQSRLIELLKVLTEDKLKNSYVKDYDTYTTEFDKDAWVNGARETLNALGADRAAAKILRTSAHFQENNLTSIPHQNRTSLPAWFEQNREKIVEALEDRIDAYAAIGNITNDMKFYADLRCGETRVCDESEMDFYNINKDQCEKCWGMQADPSLANNTNGGRRLSEVQVKVKGFGRQETFDLNNEVGVVVARQVENKVTFDARYRGGRSNGRALNLDDRTEIQYPLPYRPSFKVHEAHVKSDAQVLKVVAPAARQPIDNLPPRERRRERRQSTVAVVPSDLTSRRLEDLTPAQVDTKIREFGQLLKMKVDAMRKISVGCVAEFKSECKPLVNATSTLLEIEERMKALSAVGKELLAELRERAVTLDDLWIELVNRFMRNERERREGRLKAIEAHEGADVNPNDASEDIVLTLLKAIDLRGHLFYDTQGYPAFRGGFGHGHLTHYRGSANSALRGDGGAIDARSAVLNLRDGSSIYRGQAQFGEGGAIRAYSSTLVCSAGCEMVLCESERGGAVSSKLSVVTLLSALLKQNVAYKDGGAAVSRKRDHGATRQKRGEAQLDSMPRSDRFRAGGY